MDSQIQHMHGTSFDWLTWSGGSLTNLGITYNEVYIISMRHVIRKYAVGWIKGEEVLCRPKPNRVAVMFLKDDRFFWTHITGVEFAAVFPEVKVQ